MMSQNYGNDQLPNGWIVDSVIGRGSFGTVYKAYRKIGNSVEWAAVKHIRVPSSDDELNAIRAELGTKDETTISRYLSENVQSMLNEYLQMKSLQGHTNIVACHDICHYKSPGPRYDVLIWMELLVSLSTLIMNEEMNRTETAKMGMDICRALILLRSQKMIHRDIKPQNIFMNGNGDYKLGDFGTAREIAGTSALLSMKGTLSYMAPEIMQGKKADFSSDIYSLGMVMYRLMNRNRHPFIQESSMSTQQEIEESNARRFSGEKLPPPCDADRKLGSIILKACAFDSKDRWKTPEEMLAALQALDENTDDVPRFPKRTAAIAAGAALTVAGIITAVILANRTSAPPVSSSVRAETAAQTPTAVSFETKRTDGKTESIMELTCSPSPVPVNTPSPHIPAASAAPASSVLALAGVGETVSFGTYEQDGNTGNGKETLKWRVLKKTDSRILLITEQIIACKPFNNSYKKLRWRQSDLKSWLNGSFLNTAFSAEEKAMIRKTTVTDAGNSKYSISAGTESSDYIYLLSIEEAGSLFKSDSERRAKPTQYALDQGVAENSAGYGWWWLRSPGQDRDHAAAVSQSGSVFKQGDSVTKKSFGVRPVMWVNLGNGY